MLRSNPHREISRWHGRSAFFVLAGFFIAICLYHKYILPKPKSDKAVCEATASNIFKEFFATFVTFFQKKQVWVAVLFHATITELPEAQLVKLINPFLLGPQRIRGIRTDNGTSRFSIWYYRDFRLDDRWNHRWNRSGKRWTQKMALAYGLEYFPHLRYISFTSAITNPIACSSSTSAFLSNNSVMDLDSQLICCI